MNLFNRIRYKSVEIIDKATRENSHYVYRLAKKYNGTYTLLNSNGNQVVKEFAYISPVIDRTFRLAKHKNGNFYAIFQHDSRSAHVRAFDSANESDIKNIKQRERFFVAEKIAPNTTQITYRFSGEKNESTFFISDQGKVSKIFTCLSPANESGLQIGFLKNNFRRIYVLKADTQEELFSFPFDNETKTESSTIYSNNKESVLISTNINQIPTIYRSIKAISNNTFAATKMDGTVIIIDQNGTQIEDEAFKKVQKQNKFGEILAINAQNGKNIILSKDGIRYKKYSGDFKVIYDSPIGIRTLKFDGDKNKTYLAGLHPFKREDCQEIDANANRILFAILEGRKPDTRFFNNLVRAHSVDELARGEDIYFNVLDEIKTSNPDASDEIEKIKIEFHSMLSEYMKNRILAQKHIQKHAKDNYLRHKIKLEEKSEALENKTNNLIHVSVIGDYLSK